MADLMWGSCRIRQRTASENASVGEVSRGAERIERTGGTHHARFESSHVHEEATAVDAARAAVLLKNGRDVLPLAKGGAVAVVGAACDLQQEYEGLAEPFNKGVRARPFAHVPIPTPMDACAIAIVTFTNEGRLLTSPAAPVPLDTHTPIGLLCHRRLWACHLRSRRLGLRGLVEACRGARQPR